MARWFKEWRQERKKPSLQIADGDPYFKFNIPTDYKENPHFFMSEELLSPFVNSCDTQRLNMFASHIVQTVHLKHSEPPRVFTGFENQIGKYSVAYKKAESDFIIIGKVWKNPLNYSLVVKYVDGTYDIIEVNAARHITEEYGYKLNDCLEEKSVGDRVNRGEFIFKSDNYDDDGNFGYGVNLNAVYTPWQGLTYEDGAVLTKSAAEKLKSYKVEKTTITVNTNDILLNLYSDLNDEYDTSYHSIPKVGEYTRGNILVASRREEAQNILYNFQQNRMKEIDYQSDQVYYTNGGMVVDINIYSNLSLDKMKLKNSEFTKEVVQIYEEQYNYYKELAELLETIIPAMTEEEYIASLDPIKKQAYMQEKKEYGHYYKRPLPADQNPNKYTDQLDYMWKYAHEYIDDKISWRSDGKRYDNFKLEITILKENPITVGAKITGRYGNKGVCSAIIPDEEAPFDPVSGIRADIILNPMAIVNRLNPSQCKEQEINFIADHVHRDICQCDSVEDMQEIYLEFLKLVNKQQADFVETELIMMRRDEKQEFFDDIIENGIFIHEPPFVGNTSFDQFITLYEKHPEWLEPYKCNGIEKPLIIGAEYFIRLKHESSNKLSIRAKGMLNIKNLPSKSALKKEKKSMYNDNPIRFGEMETSYMYLSQRPDLVAKMLRAYSTNMEDRQNLVELLITAKDPLNVNLPDQSGKSITRQMLDNYLSVLEIVLED